MCGTRHHPDESPQLIVNNSSTCTVTHAVTLMKLVIWAVHFMQTATFNEYMCEPDS